MNMLISLDHQILMYPQNTVENIVNTISLDVFLKIFPERTQVEVVF